MSRLFANELVQALRRIGAGLLEPRLWLTLLAAAVVWSLAYQQKREYVVEVADTAYHPYIEGFNDIETAQTDPPFTYRWSKARPRVSFPGIGNQPVQVAVTTIGARPGESPPRITFEARGDTYTLQTMPQEHTDTFFVDRGGDPLEGGLTLQFDVPAFTPPGDPRELGVILRRVEVRPADYGLRPAVIPPLPTVLSLLAGLLGAYLIALTCLGRRSWALLSIWVFAVSAVLAILHARTDLALLAVGLPALAGWGIGLAIIARATLGGALPGGDARSAGWGALAFTSAFLLRFGGLTYPQFLTSDLLLHVHNVQGVQGGDLVFTEPLPDGRPAPYPPAYYLLVSPLTLLTGRGDEGVGLALKWSASLLDAATCLALAWCAARVWRGTAAGKFAAFAGIAYLGIPAAFDLFSAGNYANLFAQSVLNITLLGAMVWFGGSRSGWRGGALMGFGFCLTLLGHYGMMLATLPIVALFAMMLLLLRGEPRAERGRARAFVLSYLGAVATSFLLYYWRFIELIFAQLGSYLDRLLGRGSGSPGRFLEGVGKLPGKAGLLWGGAAAVSGFFGALSVGALPVRGAYSLLIGAWLGSTLGFALLDQALGDSIRWQYLGAAALALCAGRLLGLLAGRGVWCRRLSAFVILIMLTHTLLFWVDLIYTRYH